jgi:predicted naringenin-chalcone synthase
MHLLSLSTAVPDAAFSSADCWRLVEQSSISQRLKPVSLRIVRRILHTDNGVATRHFAVPDMHRIFDLDADALNLAFRDAAPALAGTALRRALDRAGLRADELDALIVCTCTGYLCPGVSSYVAESLGLRENAWLQDLVGLGCGAAIPSLRSANALICADPSLRVACVAVEVCSAAFHLDDDPGVIVSALIFADGAAATIWTGGEAADALRIGSFDTTHDPAHRDHIRFEMRNGRLRNLLHKTVPELAAGAVRRLYDRADADRYGSVLTHGGGKDVLDALEAALPGRSLDDARAVLRDNGNMSSPSVLFALERHLAANPAADNLWLTSFGAGFAAHSCTLTRR